MQKLIVFTLIFLIFSQIISREVKIDIETKFVNTKVAGVGAVFAKNLKKQIDTAPQLVGYCSRKNVVFPVNNQKLCGGGNRNIGWHFHLKFVEPYGTQWHFQYGVDFGFGGAVWVDRQLKFSNPADMWWNNNWNSNGVINTNQHFSSGTHHIDVFGAEGCCDGSFNVRFRRGNGQWRELTQQNLLNAIGEDIQINVVSKFVNQKVQGAGLLFANNLRNQINRAGQPHGYCSRSNVQVYPFNNHGLCGGGNQNIGWHFRFQFFEPYGDSWHVEFGVDFGFGGVAYADNRLVWVKNVDLWWQHNWNSPAVVQVHQHFARGLHVIDVYGAEGCCDGGFNVRFRRGSSPTWRPLTVANVKLSLQAEIRVVATTKFVNSKAPGSDIWFANHLRNQINHATQPRGYCTRENVQFPISNQRLCGSGINRNIGWHFHIKFVEPFGERWSFQFGVDFGLGGAVFVDGRLAFSHTQDFWWNNNWLSPHVFSVSQRLRTGVHVVDLYGSENCCDGLQSIKFRRGRRGQFVVLSVANIRNAIDSAHHGRHC